MCANEWASDWLTDWLIEWVSEWVSVCVWGGWVDGWRTNRRVSKRVNGRMRVFNEWASEWLIDWLIEQLIHWVSESERFALASMLVTSGATSYANEKIGNIRTLIQRFEAYCSTNCTTTRGQPWIRKTSNIYYLYINCRYDIAVLVWLSLTKQLLYTKQHINKHTHICTHTHTHARTNARKLIHTHTHTLLLWCFIIPLNKMSCYKDFIFLVIYSVYVKVILLYTVPSSVWRRDYVQVR